MIDNRSGFTLIEFLVAIVILLVGLMGLLQSVNLAMEKSSENVYRSEASVLANELILAKTTKGAFTAISTTVASPAWTVVRRSPRGIFKNYSVQTVVTQLTTGPTEGPIKLADTASKQIDVNIRWRVKGASYSHSASSVISTSSTNE